MGTVISDLELKGQIKEIIGHVARIDTKKITDEIPFRKDLLIDSIQGIQIIAAIEKKYNIEIDEVEIFNIENLNEIVELVKEYLMNQPK